ncbi:MAG: hypothetical protein R3A79_15250 [Nannocystaceae bacterium]
MGGRVTRRRSFALLAGAATLLFAGEAMAGGSRKVPDLRQDPGDRATSRAATLTVPLTVHLAATEERPAATVHRLQRSIERANQALAAYGLQVELRELLRMPEGFGSITRRRDRRRIAQYAAPNGSVHVFMVDSLELRAGRTGDRSIRGLHWRYRGILRRLRKHEYVVVSGDAPTTTLVHELGHFFGLSHSDGEENLMCSCRRGPRQIFTPKQGETIRRGARAFLRG